MKMNSGLSVAKACEILNCCKSYLYKMIQNGELQAVDTTPVTIDPRSVVEKIVSDYPYLRSSHFIKLDYEVKQESFSYG